MHVLGRFVVVALGCKSPTRHCFTVAKILAKPDNDHMVHVQWYAAYEEYGSYKACETKDHKPDTQYISVDTFVTPSFAALEPNGTLPPDIYKEVKSHEAELENMD